MNRKLGTALGATSCIATLLATAMPGLAQPKMDELSVIYGVFKGSLGVLCALSKEGLLPNSSTEAYAIYILKPNNEVPRLAQIMALKSIKEDPDFKSCLLPPLPAN